MTRHEMDDRTRLRKLEERVHRLENTSTTPSPNLRDLADADLSKASDGQTIVYDQPTGQWRPADAGSGGGGGGGLVLTATPIFRWRMADPQSIVAPTPSPDEPWTGGYDLRMVRWESYEDFGLPEPSWASTQVNEWDGFDEVRINEDGLYAVKGHTRYGANVDAIAGRLSVFPYDVTSAINYVGVWTNGFEVTTWVKDQPNQVGMFSGRSVETWWKLEAGALIQPGRGFNYTEQALTITQTVFIDQVARHVGPPLYVPEEE